jgi:DNA-binding response OmpR family regulator
MLAAREELASSAGLDPGVSGLRPVTARRRRALLVEDEDMVRKVLTRMMTARGFEVHGAASGSEAMALFEASDDCHFDLLVTDLMMPEGGGHAVARRFCDKIPGLRVLFVSGYSSTEAQEWEPEHFRFLTKPFGSAELVRAIDDLFREEGSAAAELP